jgi:GNAT superfamily N-acetyltransferase
MSIRHATIRPLAEADYAEWLILWKGYQRFYQSDIADEVSRVAFSRMLSSEEPTFGALATDGQRSLGLVHWIHHRSNWTIGNYCYLQDLYVDESNRGLGVGRMLIEHVYAEARKAGCSRVYWLTHETNATAMQLYDRIAERTGFVHYKKSL